MRTVYEYPLASGMRSAVAMPRDSTILLVSHQEGNLTLWAEVDTDYDQVTRNFEVVPTGGPCPLGSSHVGTAVIGGFVWHVYEIR